VISVGLYAFTRHSLCASCRAAQTIDSITYSHHDCNIYINKLLFNAELSLKSIAKQGTSPQLPRGCPGQLLSHNCVEDRRRPGIDKIYKLFVCVNDGAKVVVTIVEAGMIHSMDRMTSRHERAYALRRAEMDCHLYSLPSELQRSTKLSPYTLSCFPILLFTSSKQPKPQLLLQSDYYFLRGTRRSRPTPPRTYTQSNICIPNRLMHTPSQCLSASSA
jgi:hypothetical protein